MKTVQLQKHLSSNFSANLILAPVCIQNHPAGDVTRVSEDDSENRGLRDLKKYYVYRYGCPIKDVKKRRTRTRWRGCRLFYLLFCTVYCSGNKLKINTICGKFYYSTYLVLKFFQK